ncbi:MAG: DUF4864 domain-containing protein [Candidatus Devosia symbiotica]|nr:DUF4864 domain-containing protein [Candidatus Devosia symbiotica]
MRILLALTMVMALLLPSVAQDDVIPWQISIIGQGEAFYGAILATGYRPVMQSRSHSFGKFAMVSDRVVVQVMLLVGPDQELYEALYQLEDEPREGWRVVGVVLRKRDGIRV